ncbi:MAG: response regulator transcription factor [Xanthomonadales bacterium]|nr:response regulator transcription factor [Xanthomonadales bacterium]
MLLRAAIVEDEPLAAQLLHRWLAESPDTAIVGSADSLPSAQTMIEQCSIDVLLLDINLAGEDGFCLAEAGYRQNLFEIIFVSAHAYYALPAFRVDAVDFLRKPFSRAQLFEALERVRRRIDSRRRLGAGKLRIRDGDSLKLVPCAAIQWIESAGGYSVVHTREQRHITREPLARLITQLGEGFARIHRSLLVNLSLVESVQALPHGDALLCLVGGHQLRMSRRYRSVLQRLDG